jgi:hypothetical protein
VDGAQEKEMIDKRSPVFVGKMIGIDHSWWDRGGTRKKCSLFFFFFFVRRTKFVEFIGGTGAIGRGIEGFAIGTEAKSEIPMNWEQREIIKYLRRYRGPQKISIVRCIGAVSIQPFSHQIA